MFKIRISSVMKELMRGSATRAGGGINNLLLFHANQLNLKNQSRVWRNRACYSPLAVSEIPRNRELSFASNLHTRNAMVPTGNHITLADSKRKRNHAVERAVKFGAVGQRARVVHRNRVACFGFGAGPDFQILNNQFFFHFFY